MKMKASYGGGGGDQYINPPYCYFHPEEIVVGVCALCLKERLLELALKQGHNLLNINIPKAKAKDSSSSGGGARRSSSRAAYSSTRRKHSFSTLLPNVFALPSFLRVVDDITCRQHHQQRRRPHDEDHKYSSSSSSDHGSITSLEDSFISIKFEDNGEASWGESKKKQKQVELEEEFNINAETSSSSKLGSRRVVLGEKSLVEHVIKQRGPGVPLRWRKRIGQLLQLSRWSNYKNKSSKTAAGHVGGLVGKVQDHQGRRGWMRSLTTRTSRRRTTGPLAS